MDIDSFDQRAKRLELREKLLEIAEQRSHRVQGIPAKNYFKITRENTGEKKWNTRLKPAHRLTIF